MQGEAASADAEATASYPEDLVKIIHKSGHPKQQTFSVDKRSLYWKMIQFRTFIAREEKSMPDFKVSEDKLTLVLGAKAASDLKLKPVFFYHSKSPTALKNYAKSTLPVLYKRNNKTQMTAHLLFTTWITEYFQPSVESSAQKEKVPFKYTAH